MNFSLDTNIILGVVNPKDRLHEISTSLMKKRQTEQLYICVSALKESTTVLRTKINDVFVEFFRRIPDLSQISKLQLYDLHSLILDIFKQIKDEKPGLENFLKLVYQEIIDFLEKNPISKLPAHLSEFSIKYSRSAIQEMIEEIHSISGFISLDADNHNGVKKALSGIHFRNNNDEEIFTELMTNLNLVKPIEFFSNDEEFAKKSRLGYTEIARIFMFDNKAFSFVLI